MASILKTKTGKFRVQIEHLGRREYRTFDSKTLATRWSIQREAEIQQGMVASVDEAQRTPLQVVIDDFRERILPTKRGHHLKYSLELIERKFGHFRLLAITTRDVSSFRDERLQEGRAGSTVVKDLNLLRALLDHASNEMNIHLPTNVARVCRNPRQAPSRERVLEKDEEKALLDSCTHPMLKPVIVLAIETAMRLGELLSMRYDDINFESRTLKIPTTKTDKPRTIPLSTVAVDALLDMPRPGKNSRIFSCWKRADSFEKCFRRAVLKAGLVDFRFHDLRHTATSRLATKLPNPIELALVTGHSSLQMLSRYYHVKAVDLVAKLS
jgi:integrase